MKGLFSQMMDASRRIMRSAKEAKMR